MPEADSRPFGTSRFTQVVVVIVTLLGAAGLGSLASRGPPVSTVARDTRAPAESAIPSAPYEAAVVKPTPLIRPLELLARAAAIEPLFEAGADGRPVLAAAYQRVLPPGPGTVAGYTDCALFSAVHAQLARRHMVLTTVIATLPDWVDSSLKWTFDAELDALQAGAARLDFVSTAFDLPESTPSTPAPSVTESRYRLPRLHETTPGALLFRKAPSAETGQVDLLLILLVGETPTAGVHHRALTAAIQFAQLWHAIDLAGHDTELQPAECFQTPVSGSTTPLRILGPTYSGSAASLRMVINDAVELPPPQSGAHPSVEDAVVDIVTPSASSYGNIGILKGPGISFRSVTHSDNEVLGALARFLASADSGWGCGEGVALLVEADTAWGHQILANPATKEKVTRKNECDECRSARHPTTPMACAAMVPFPIHIAQLRSAASAAAGNPVDAAVSRAQTALNLADNAPPADRIPAATPDLTGASVELMIGGMFQAIDRSDVTAIGVLATDKRDHIYLAEQIARRRPNVLTFTIESDLIYLHPDVAGYLRGTVVASTYSLDERSQRMTRPAHARRYPQQFGSSAAHGDFNALAMLMGHESLMLDYDMPAGPGEPRARDPEAGPCRPTKPPPDPPTCRPAVWISIAAQGMLLPIAAGKGLDEKYAAEAGEVREGAKVGPLDTGSGADRHTPLQPSQRTQWPLLLFLMALGASGAAYLVVWLMAKKENAKKAVPAPKQGESQPPVRVAPGPPQPGAGAATADGRSAPATLTERLRRGRTRMRHPWSKLATVVSRAFEAPDAMSPLEAAQSACREMRASELAILGAGLLFGFWLLKLAVITVAVATDRALVRWNPAQMAYILLCGAAVVYFWCVVADAFWLRRASDGRRRYLLPVPFAVFAIGVAAWAIVPDLVRLEVITLDRGTTDLVANGSLGIAIAAGIAALLTNTRADWSRTLLHDAEFLRRVPVLLGFGAMTCLAASMTLRHWNSFGAQLFAERASDLMSLVSPSIVVLGLGTTIIWWATWNVRRVDLLLLPEIQVGVGAFLDYGAKHSSRCAEDALRSPSLSVGKLMLGPVLVAGFTLAAGYGNVGSIEGRAFSGFLLLGSACLLTALAHTLVHTRALGNCVLDLLAVLRRHPAAGVFAKLAAEPFDWGVTYRAVHGSDLQSIAARIAKIGAVLKSMHPADAAQISGSGFVQELVAESTDVAGRLMDGRNGGGRDPVGRDNWAAIDQLTRNYAAVLQPTRWDPGYAPSAVGRAVDGVLADMEFAVVFHASMILRDVLTRIITGLTAVFGGLLVLLLTNLLYTFQGRIFWLSVDAIAIVLSGAVAIRLLVRLERDTVVSLLWGTTPGRLSLFGGLAPRIAAFGAAALVTIFTVFFPEVIGDLPSWLAPLTKVLR